MMRSVFALLALTFVFLQADCYHITRMSISPYFQPGYADCGCSRYTKPCLYIPAKTTTCTTVPHCSPCPAKTTTCTTVPHPPPPPPPACFEPFYLAPKPVLPCGSALLTKGSQYISPYSGLFCSNWC